MCPGTLQANPVPKLNAVELIRWIFRRRRRFRIVGPSMGPTLNDGDVVLVTTVKEPFRPYTDGEIILCRHPYKTDVCLVKRIERQTEDGRLFVVGDRQDESTDSRSFGAIHPERVIGRVTCTLFRS